MENIAKNQPESKIRECQKRASTNYKAKALQNVSFLLMPEDQAAFDALKALAQHYGSNAKALKAAIVAHAQQLGH